MYTPMCTLLRLLLPDHSYHDTLAPAQVLFQATCSGSGTEVVVAGNTQDVQPPVGVLMLGFAGSSTRILKIVMDSMYLKHYPGWRVVATTASGLASPHGDEHSSAAFSAQMDAIVSGLSGCRKLLVHVMSNNGHGLWGSLLAHRSAQIAPRMGAIVYDCAAARRDAKPDNPEDMPGQAYGGWAHVLVATIWMQVRWSPEGEGCHRRGAVGSRGALHTLSPYGTCAPPRERFP